MGALFKKEKAPSIDEINEATRIKVNGKDGIFMYCDDENTNRYASNMIKCAKIAKKDILTYMDRQSKCLSQRQSEEEKPESTQSHYYYLFDIYSKSNFSLNPPINAETKPPEKSEKEELETIKQEIETNKNV